VLDYIRDATEIYRQSFATIRAEADLGGLPEPMRTVVVRMIHASGDTSLAGQVDHHVELVRATRDALDGGAPIFTAAERHTQAISPTTAYLMSSMLSDVISAGTGSPARAAGFKLPAAGKTGTTDNYADAWFVGYTPHLVAGIWFGFDRPAPIMRSGFAGVVAVPAWGRFMRAATVHDKPDWYAMPADVEKVAICRLSGARATEACRHQADMYSVARDGASPQLVPMDALVDQDDQTPANTLAAGEPPVYEDLFPVGAVPPDICPMHNPSAAILGITSSVLAPSSSPVATSGTFTTATSDIVLERVLGADGLMHMIMRQRR